MRPRCQSAVWRNFMKREGWRSGDASSPRGFPNRKKADGGRVLVRDRAGQRRATGKAPSAPVARYAERKGIRLLLLRRHAGQRVRDVSIVRHLFITRAITAGSWCWLGQTAECLRATRRVLWAAKIRADTQRWNRPAFRLDQFRCQMARLRQDANITQST